MHRFALFCVLGVVLVQAGDLEFLKKCGRFVKAKEISCCNKKYISGDVLEQIKECMELPAMPPCEREICAAKKKGYGLDDGAFDKASLKAVLNNFEDKDLIQSIIDDCVDGDLSLYGSDDMCDLKKLNTCVNFHLVVDCPEWSNDGHCNGSSEAAAECINLFT